MTDYEKYAAQVALVKEECKDADDKEIAEEFRRYQEEFLIEPNDAVRSVIMKFQKASGKEVSSISSMTSLVMVTVTVWFVEVPPANVTCCVV